jgi:hypothetical protein
MRLRWDGIIARLSYRFNFLAIRGIMLGSIYRPLAAGRERVTGSIGIFVAWFCSF